MFRCFNFLIDRSDVLYLNRRGNCVGNLEKQQSRFAEKSISIEEVFNKILTQFKLQQILLLCRESFFIEFSFWFFNHAKKLSKYICMFAHDGKFDMPFLFEF